MSKHTPGPWSYCINGLESAFLIRDKQGRLLAMPSWHGSDDTHYPLKPESEANSRLMAAAPALLEALDTIAFKPICHAEASHEEVLSEVVQIARAAIAKAQS